MSDRMMDKPHPIVPRGRLSRRGLLSGAVGIAGAAGLARIAGGRESTPQPTTPYGVPVVSLDQMPGVDPMRDPAMGTAWLGTLTHESPLLQDPDGNIRSGVVIDWTVSADGLQVDLRVRPDALFADGTLVTAGDVAASLERCRALSSVGAAGHWERIAGIEAIEGDTVRLLLVQPDVTILASLAAARAPIVPRRWTERDWGDTPDRLPPGSGPFMLSGIEDRRITLDRHPAYRQVGRPHLAGLVVTASSGTVPRTTELVTGAVDVVIDVPLLNIPTLRDDPNLTLVGGLANRLCLLSVNVRAGPLRDRRLRSLISGAIDRAALLDAAVASEGEPATGLFPEGSWIQSGIEPDAAPRSPEDVRSELAADGHVAGLRLRLIADERDASIANACVLLQEQLAHAGIAVALDLLPTEEMARATREESWDLLAMYSDFWRDPDELLRPLFHAKGHANFGRYTSDRVSSLIDLAITARNPQHRAQLYRVVQQIARVDVPLIPLFFPAYYDAMTNRIGPYDAYPPVTGLAMRQVRMEPPDRNPSG